MGVNTGRALAAIVLCTLLHGTPQSQDWQRIGPDGGMPIALEVPDPSGSRAYALGQGGLFRSDDRGTTWSTVAHPEAQIQTYQSMQLRVSRQNPDALLLFSPTRVWRSQDGGDSWSVLPVQAPAGARINAVTEVAVSPDNPNHISVFLQIEAEPPMYPGRFFSSYLWQSENGSTPSHAARLSSQVPGCTQLVASQHDHVHASAYHAGDLYYAHLYTCGPETPIPDSGQGNRLHRQSGGLSVRLSAPSYMAPGFRLQGQLHPSGQHVFARSGSSLQRIDLTTGNVTMLRSTSGSTRLMPDGSLVSSDDSGVYRSINDGDIWTRIDNATLGLTGPAHLHRHAAGFLSPTRWLAGSSDGIFRSDSMGSTWLPSHQGFSSMSLRAIAINPHNEDQLWLGTATMMQEGWDYRPRDRVLFTSTDGGLNWSFGDLSNRAILLRALALDPATAQAGQQATLYATGMGCINVDRCPAGVTPGQNLFKSMDSGATWTSLAPELASTARTLRAIALAPALGSPGARTLHAAHTQTLGSLIARSTDAGTSWSLQTQGLPPASAGSSATLDIKVAPTDNLRVYLSAEGYGNNIHANGVYRSDDGGESWSQRSNGLPTQPGNGDAHTGVLAIAVHPGNRDVVWALTVEQSEDWTYHNRVFRSNDGGNTWQASWNGLPRTDHRSLIVDPNDPNLLYVGGTSGVFHSLDGGQSWQLLGSAIAQTLTLAASSQHVFAAGSAGLLRIERPRRGDPVFCSGFEPGQRIRSLDPRCSGRLFDLPDH